MRRPLVGGLLAVLFALAGPGFAGTVYIPVAAAVEIDGVTYETRVAISNDGTDTAEFRTFFIPVGTDGTERGGAEGQLIVLLPGATFETTPEAGFLGLLEVSGDPDLVFDARLIGVLDGDELLGVQVPVITSQNLTGANQTGHLQGWLRDATHLASFGVVNLGHQSSTCSVDVLRDDGLPLIEAVDLVWPGLSLRHFDDSVLALLGQFEDARAAVTCDQPFYTYATTLDLETAEAAFIAPSALGTSTLSIPGAGPACPVGSFCFEFPGVFHSPSPGNLVKRVQTTPPPGQYRRIHATLKVVHGGWAPGNSSGVHNIFWFARDRNRDLFGYLNVKGPGANEIFFRHGIGLEQGQKPRVTQGLAMNPGETYEFEYTYDTEQRFIDVVTRDQNGQQVSRLQGVPNVNSISLNQGQKFLWDFGFLGINPNEPPTIGWGYRDLFVEFVP